VEENVRVIAPGFVYIKQALTQQEQIFWTEYALEVGNNPTQGFWNREIHPDGTITLIPNLISRSRIYDAITAYKDPESVTTLCQSLVRKAREVDSQMPLMSPTHLLILLYTSSEGMYWHSDNDVNDGDNDHPIVSVSLGNSCDFGYRLDNTDEAGLHMTLESGDVLVWGGPLRMLQHTVFKVFLNTCPDYLPLNNTRLNFTFRDAPNMIGKEDEWRTPTDTRYITPAKIKPQEEVVEQTENNFCIVL